MGDGVDHENADTSDPTTHHKHSVGGRPMNAFFLFCKRHRAIVKEKYPTLENRNITKILGEWWSNLNTGEKASYTSLASQYKDAFMKANPDFRWHKMPPVSMESLPSAAQKPPVSMNGDYAAGSKPGPDYGPGSKLTGSASRGSSSSSSPEPQCSSLSSSSLSSLQGNILAAASAPKPFKKRYLAEQHSASITPTSTPSRHATPPATPRATPPATPSGHATPSRHSTPPATSSVNSTPPLTPAWPYDGNFVVSAANPTSPVGEEAANACAALLELANPGHARLHGRGSPSQGSPNTEPKRPSPSDTPQRVSPSETPPFQTLREQVWSRVAGTLLKQEEDKLTEPCRDSPLNLTNQCTIRGQQIIEHIIENILDKPIEDVNPAEPVTFSLNNNTGHAAAAGTAAATSDTIKASIYQSLKNDLLKKGPSSLVPEAAGHQVPGLQADLRKAFGNGAGPKPKAAKKPEPAPSRVDNNVTNAQKQFQMVKQGVAGVANIGNIASSPADVMRLFTHQPLGSPVSVGGSSVTITKTRTIPPQISQPTSFSTSPSLITISPTSNISFSSVATNVAYPLATKGGGSRSYPSMIMSPVLNQMSPVSHSLSPVRSHMSHPVSPVSSMSHSGLVLPPQGQVIIATSSSRGKLVLASSEQSTTPVNLSVTKLENTANAASENRQLPVKYDKAPSQSNHCPVSTAIVSNVPQGVASHAFAVNSTPHSQAFAVTTAPHSQVYATTSMPQSQAFAVSSTPHSQAYAMTSAPHSRAFSVNSTPQSQAFAVKTAPPASTAPPQVYVFSHGAPGGSHSQPNIATSDTGSASKRTHPDDDDEDIRRSGRACKGKLYRGFIVDGRISVGGRKGRRSHRSGDDEELESDGMIALEQEEGQESINHNHHWKKKLRTVSLNDNNTQGDSNPDPHLVREPHVDHQVHHAPSNTATNHLPPNFDLNAKIEALRPLSLEDFTRKREESKKESRGRSSNSGSSRTTRQSNSGDRASKPFDTGASSTISVASVGPGVQVGRSRRRPTAQSPVT